MLAEASWATYIGLTVALSITYAVYTKLSRQQLPPGPLPLPFIGNALAILGRPLHVTFASLQRRYGDVFCIKVANAEVVVINGYENIKEALSSQGKKFSGRPDITWTSITQKHGFFSMEGPNYHKQKAVTMSILRDIAWDQKDAAETKIQKAGNNLVSWLTDQVDKPVNPQIYLDTAVCNVTSEPLMGVTFTPTDPLMMAVSKIVMDIFIDAGAQNVNNYFTFLRNLPGDLTNYQTLTKNATTAMDVVRGLVKSHKDKQTENADNPREDFIDHYLDRITEGTDALCTDHQLVAVVTDLFAMGIEASSTTLRWALRLTCEHPEAQSRIQKEIDEVMQTSTPSLEHQSEMNFTRSFIAEVQRYVNVVSINLPHATTEDVTFHGYQIPKGAIVLPNLASIHYDEKTYPNPFTFIPDRFISPQEGFQQPDKFMPYSTGTRMCPGKNLSQWQIFLLLTAILQKFDIKLCNSSSGSKIGEDIYGLIRFPAHFNGVFSSRA